MDKHFSRYLDLMRFAAAVLVVVSHFTTQGMFGDAHGSVPDFGREAVMVFFLLSGFVIAYTTSEKSLSLQQYVVARSARIYSVAIPIVLLCFLMAYVVTQLTDAPFNSSYQLHKPYLYLPLHWLFLGELWTLAEVPPFLIQYWSLSYEVWYYVLFGVAFYLRGAKRLLLTGLVLLVMGHKLWLLLPVWLAGAYLYKYQKNLALTQIQARLGWLATIVLLCAFKYYGFDLALRALGHQIWPFASLHLGSADRYLADYVVCILIYFNFLFARQAAFSALQWIDTPIRTLSAYTFTLYLIHGPVMGAWMLLFPQQEASALNVILLSLCICLATYVTGMVTEQRKAWFQASFTSLYLWSARRFA